jgi:hypothetical protein
MKNKNMFRKIIRSALETVLLEFPILATSGVNIAVARKWRLTWKELGLCCGVTSNSGSSTMEISYGIW